MFFPGISCNFKSLRKSGKMPIRHIGRKTEYKGKFLFEILSNLKNFGVGRMVVRRSYLERYPEVSYYIIKRAQPDMSHAELKRGNFRAEQVFRGKKYDEIMHVTTAYKNDWWLIPKDEEASLLSNNAVYQPRVAPAPSYLPPLLAQLYTDKLKRQGIEATEEDLQMRRKIRKGVKNRTIPESEPSECMHDEQSTS